MTKSCDSLIEKNENAKNKNTQTYTDTSTYNNTTLNPRKKLNNDKRQKINAQHCTACYFSM